MKIGLVGYPGSGKTTVFNALTGQEAATGFGGRDKANIAVVKVPDERVDALAALFTPKKTTYAEITFRDLVMPYTTPQDLCGLPACALRAGFDADGVPVGVQFTGPPWSEARVLRAAQALFDATPELQRRRPRLP